MSLAQVYAVNDFATVQSASPKFDALLATAETLQQAKYIVRIFSHAEQSVLFGAFQNGECLGFLRVLVQVIGSEEGRTSITSAGSVLREGFVEAFGVLPGYRRQGIGQELQAKAIAFCREQGCYQIRSLSPVTSTENYSLKLKMGYAIHPNKENDSYYFIKTLQSFIN